MLREHAGMTASPNPRPRPAWRRRLAPALVAALAGLLAACGEIPLLQELAPEKSCRQTMRVGPLGVPLPVAEPVEGTIGNSAPADAEEVEDGEEAAEASSPEVEWKGPRSGNQRHQLNAWCAAVGPAVFGGWADPPTSRVDTVVVVSWNLHVGGGDLEGLVRDLREGALTGGRPPAHFVLLLQEAHRKDDTVPAFQPAFALGSGVYASPPGQPRRDIVEAAERLGLSLFYAPSMRNGVAEGEPEPEDRGNAILSTLPLADPVAIELPVARQRRVALAAHVRLGPSDDDARQLLVGSVHLENDAAGFASDEQARLVQTEALLEGLPESDAAVAAGDYNTWRGAQEEALVPVMLEAFPDTPPLPPGPTYIRGFGLLRRYLDYVFVRLPDGAHASVHRVPDAYNSDHFPLVATVGFPDD